VFGIATAVQADIPDSGVIHGCYGKPGTPQKGQLRVRDASKGEGCRYYENKLDWNAAGVTEATAATGPTGPTGPKGATGPAGLTEAVGATSSSGGTPPASPTGQGGITLRMQAYAHSFPRTPARERVGRAGGEESPLVTGVGRRQMGPVRGGGGAGLIPEEPRHRRS
jgi:hypothetical protein